MARRPDGRATDALRPVTIERHFLKHVPGSVMIAAGDTKVLACVTAEDGVPGFRVESGGGWLTAEYAMLPASTSTRVPRRSGGREKEIQRLIGRSLRAVTDLGALGPITLQVDCDVIQADGGTRTAAITGAYVALADCLAALHRAGRLAPDARPLKEAVAAVSVGIVGEQPMLDLDYPEDVAAAVDFNVVMTSSGRFVEVQGTAEAEPFTDDELQRLLALARAGIVRLLAAQEQALAAG